MNVSIICPIYNGEKYIESLNESLEKQKNVCIKDITYILTESKDNSEIILKNFSLNYSKISKKDFSHSLTREKFAMKAKGQIIVFITQDIIIQDDVWLYELTKDISNGICHASFSRQVSNSKGIEHYIRPKNYPNKSRIVSNKDIDRYGLMTFFFSDASAAIRKDIFVKLNGYDNKNLIISEDMYIAYKLIKNGYKIKYCSNSVVIHSHEFTLKQLFNRYFDTGVFFANNNYLNKYGENKSGFSLLKDVAKNSLASREYRIFFNILPNFASRFIGMKLGKNYKKISKNLIKKFSLNKLYWDNKMMDSEE
ncbi:glycosyltransferase [Clostridium sp. Marseille-Q2269]|uniref:glycosyltransferase n=1 Tax=Clostridium sp. Marseille-Q2269 TaxID=2942205 RepID=UPI0020734D26|nr:glycosyltransferase [Clostridium sp. Marseille-Q2269]